MSVQNHFF